jgi:subtilisin-like proprotein convertase family protein
MDKRFLRTALLVIGLLTLGTAGAQATWIDLGGQRQAAPELTASQIDAHRVRVEIVVPGFETDQVQIEGATYAKVMLPGHVQLLDAGVPQLPYLTASLIVADEGTPAVKIVAAQYEDVPTTPIVPSKGNLLRTVDPNTVPYTFGAAYRGGVFPAVETELSEPYIVRDHRGVNLRVYPLRWDADRGVLRALTHMTVEVTTTGAGGVNPKRASRSLETTEFRSLYQSQFLNFDGGAKYALNDAVGPMLIVCNDALVSAMAPFIEWKSMRGLDVELITTSSVGGTTTGIKAAIQQRYDSAAGLAFVILVGDGQQLPSYSGQYEGANDDTRYVYLDGSDLYPDALISRISAQTVTQAQIQVKKFVDYERYPQAGATWYAKATGIASNEGSPTDAVRCDWLRDALLAYNFTDVDRIYQGQGGSTAGIAAAVNEGRSLINYIGHGSGLSWGSVYFGNADVHALTNQTAWPWIIDVSCLNGGIAALNESFAEAWMRTGTAAAPEGAIGIYAASTSTPWVPPCVMQTEAMNLLVTDTSDILGVLVHGGIMQVLDEYGATQGSTGQQLVEQYNLFGDCSLQVRTATPAAMTVVHQPVLPLGATTFGVDTGVPGVACALYGNGIVYGAAKTDAAGHAEIALDVPVTEVGTLQLTCFGYNLLTYQADVLAIVPANVAITPATVPVGVTTSVAVVVTDPDNGLGMANVSVGVAGYGFNAVPAQTDAAGRVVIQVTPLYGETLMVTGREVGANYDLFHQGLPVTGATVLPNAAIAASVPSIGLVGSLTPHLAGEVSAAASVGGFTLFLDGGGLDVTQVASGKTLQIAVTPTQLSDVTAAIARSGYQVFSTTIPVVEAFGSLAGTVVTSAQVPVSGARVRGFHAGADPQGTPLFDLTTDAQGQYAVAGEMAVGSYDLYVTKFGMLPLVETYFLLFGANDHQVVVQDAPTGLLTGTVTASEDGTPLAATVRVYRTDTGELYTEVTADASGVFTTTPLPYFDYNLVVRSYRRIPQTAVVTIGQAGVTRNFALAPTEGDLLVLDDNPRQGGWQPAKLFKDRFEVAAGYLAPPCRALADMVADLENLGYTVTVEDVASTNPGTWTNYDALLVSSGNNTSPLTSTALRAALTAYKAAGGKLLIEGGEVAYSFQFNDAAFFQNVLHCADWNHDSAGNITVAVASHQLMNVPNVIHGPITLTYAGYGDADGVVAATTAQMPARWSSYATEASVICYDNNPVPLGGQFVFFLFNYGAAGAGKVELLHNAVNWLITPEVGTSGISGTVDLAGEADDSGALVTVNPGGHTAVTGPSGSFSFSGLFAGTYAVSVTKSGFTSGTTNVVVADNAVVGGVNFTLFPYVSQDFCDSPALAIPDNNATGITCPVQVAASGELVGIEVYVDITHTYVGDLTVELISPQNTVVRLHNLGQGGAADNIVGWYPDPLVPYEPLTSLLGQQIHGTWSLRVIDGGQADVGTLNSWCLRLNFPSSLTPVGDDLALPKALSLDGNYPNPFNPSTQIRFSLPSDQRVELAVYDLRGQKIATLINEALRAGRHDVTWLGQDDRGRQVSSGTYVYRLTADGRTLTNKMLLLK